MNKLYTKYLLVLFFLYTQNITKANNTYKIVLKNEFDNKNKIELKSLIEKFSDARIVKINTDNTIDILVEQAIDIKKFANRLEKYNIYIVNMFETKSEQELKDYYEKYIK